MKNAYQEQMPKISITVLATLCFVTLTLCQTRFKITKEMSREVYPPVMRSRDCWFLYTIGNPDSFKCVLRVFIVVTSPLLSLASTALLLVGKSESNPYLFIPWLFLTMKGLLLIQTENLMSILREMSTRENYTFGFRAEDLKWMLFYVTIFMINLVETFSFCEVFELFLVLWNHSKPNNESANLEAVKKDIADIMGSLSKCSLGSLSKISLGTTTDSEGTNDSNTKEVEGSVKLSGKEEEKFLLLREALSKSVATGKGEPGQNVSKSSDEDEFRTTLAYSVKTGSEKEEVFPVGYEKALKAGVRDPFGLDGVSPQKVKLLPPEGRQECKAIGDSIASGTQKRDLAPSIGCS